MTPEIGITGGGGRLASAVARQIAVRGLTARLISRRPSSDGGPQSMVFGDLDQPGTLPGAMLGLRTLVLITADGPHQAEQGRAALDAAVAAGVAQIILISAMLAGETPPLSFGVQHAAIERALLATGLGYTILRPSFFMQSFGLFARDIARGRLIVPVRTGKVAFVDRDDVAEAVALLAINGAAAGKTLILTGPEPLDFRTVAGALSAVTGRKVRHIAPPRGLVRLVLPIAGGLDRWTANRLIEMFAALEEGHEAAVHDDLSRLIGRPAATFADYLRREAGDFTR